MTKDKYKQIRNRDNFLFVFYQEHGGYVKDINKFNTFFNSWLSSNGFNRPYGELIIKQNLDKRYQYVK